MMFGYVFVHISKQTLMQKSFSVLRLFNSGVSLNSPWPLTPDPSPGGDQQREVQHEPRPVGAGLPGVRDDGGAIALPRPQGAGEAGGGGAARAGGGGGVQRQVHRGHQGHLQDGECPRGPPSCGGARGRGRRPSWWITRWLTCAAADQRPQAEAGLPGGRRGGRQGPLLLQKHQLQEAGGRHSGAAFCARRE